MKNSCIQEGMIQIYSGSLCYVDNRDMFASESSG